MGSIKATRSVVAPLTPVHLERYARVMVWALEDARRGSGPGGIYVPGDIVILGYDPAAAPLAERIYPLLLQRGLHVALDPAAGHRMEKSFFQNAGETQLKFLSPWRKELYRNANGRIYLMAPESLTHLKDCDPDKMAATSLARKELWDITNERERSGLYGWTLCGMPTAALARRARMSKAEYARQIVKACYLDEEDPVARWTDTMTKIHRVKKWLTGLPIEYIHVKSEDGRTDLKVWLGQERRWLGGTGHNIPSFEVYVSPEAGHAEGRFYANEASFKMGRYVRGVELDFRGGEVVGVKAEAGEEFVRSRVALDEGSKLIGEFSLTDRRFSEITRFMAETLYDENVGGANGNCHIAIGAAYTESYSGSEPMTQELAKRLRFSDSAEHWDLVTTAPRTVIARLGDGSDLIIYRDGMFTCEF